MSPSCGDKEHLLASCLLVPSIRARRKSQAHWEGELAPGLSVSSAKTHLQVSWADVSSRKEGAHLGLLLLSGVLSPLHWDILGDLSPRPICFSLSTLESSCDCICGFSGVYS